MMYSFIEGIMSADSLESSMLYRVVSGPFSLKGSEEYLLWITVALALLCLIKGALLFLANYLNYLLSNNIYLNLALRVYESYVRLDYGELIKINSADVVRTATTDVINTYRNIKAWITIIQEIMVAGMMTLYLMIQAPVLVLSAIVFVLVLFLLIRKLISPPMNLHAELKLKAVSESMKEINHANGAIKQIKINHLQDSFEAKYRNAVENVRRHTIIADTLSMTPKIILENVTLAAAFTGLFFLMKIHGTGIQSYLPMMGTFLLAFFRILPSVSRITTYYSDIVVTEPSLESVFGLIHAGQKKRTSEETKEKAEKAKRVKKEKIKITKTANTEKEEEKEEREEREVASRVRQFEDLIFADPSPMEQKTEDTRLERVQDYQDLQHHQDKVHGGKKFRDAETEEIKEETASGKSQIQAEAIEGLKLTNLSFCFDESDVPLLSQIDLEIPLKTSAALIGPTGSGKSTLADLILGLRKPSEGTITFMGKDISKHEELWAKTAAYVPQAIFLTDDTIEHNVTFGSAENREHVIEALKEANIWDFVQDLPEGLDTVVGEHGVRLSGGQRQRIGIARALYRKPEFLVMDEATSALDQDTEKAIVETIDSYNGKITVLIIAHRLSTISGCESVYRVEDGGISRVR